MDDSVDTGTVVKEGATDASSDFVTDRSDGNEYVDYDQVLRVFKTVSAITAGPQETATVDLGDSRTGFDWGSLDFGVKIGIGVGSAVIVIVIIVAIILAMKKRVV